MKCGIRSLFHLKLWNDRRCRPGQSSGGLLDERERFASVRLSPPGELAVLTSWPIAENTTKATALVLDLAHGFAARARCSPNPHGRGGPLEPEAISTM